jgi:hypothetical protein
VVAVLGRIDPDKNEAVRYHILLVDYWGKIPSGSAKARSDIEELKLVPIRDLDPFPISKQLKETIVRQGPCIR